MDDQELPESSVQLFEGLVQSIDEYAIFALDLEGRSMSWNPGVLRIKGYTAEEIAGRYYGEFFLPEDRAKGIPEFELEQARLRGQTSGEGWRVRKSGEKFWANYVLSAMYNRQNEHIGFSKILRDLSDRRRFEEQMLELHGSLREERDRMYAAAKGSLDALFICDAVRDDQEQIIDFTFRYLNTNVTKMITIPRDVMHNGRMSVLFPWSGATGLFDRCCEVVKTGVPYVGELQVNDVKVNCRSMRVQTVRVGDGVAIAAVDITEQKANEQKVRQAADFQHAIFASSPYTTIVTDLEGVIVSSNPAAERMLWYQESALVGHFTLMVLFERTEVVRRAAFLSEQLNEPIEPGFDVLTRNPRAGIAEETEWKLIRRDGSRFDAQVTVNCLADRDGKVSGYVMLAYDITAKKREQAYMTHLAHHDALTGLPTRSLLQDRLEIALARAQRFQHKVCLLMVDLDDFKRVNDQMGHHCGDELLIVIAKRLRESVRRSDTVARMGGDEFVILMDDVHNAAEAEKFSATISRKLRAPVALNGRVYKPSASIGICIYPDFANSSEALLRNADVAMYEAKSAGKNAHRSFSQSLEASAMRKRQLSVSLVHALERKELSLAFQPQVSLRTGQVTGVEALLRWSNPQIGDVSPVEFIPLAEETGQIVAIGEWVLRNASFAAAELARLYGRPITMAVNVSPLQFQSANFALVVSRCLEDAGVDPAMMELEITENILLHDTSTTITMIEELRRLGVRIAIDDFGTGFSSMAYLLRFKVDRLKIDKSFVLEMTRSASNRAITVAVIALSRSLNIPSVAEGVETDHHRALLVAEGCDEAQGFLYSRPVDFNQLCKAIEHLETARLSEPGQMMLIE